MSGVLEDNVCEREGERKSKGLEDLEGAWEGRENVR